MPPAIHLEYTLRVYAAVIKASRSGAPARHDCCLLVPTALAPVTGDQDGLVHPKYQLPASCFAHVGNVADIRTWHLPYLRADGTPDLTRPPKAIQAILSNYRGRPRQHYPRARHPRSPGNPRTHGHELRKLPAAGLGRQGYAQLQAALEQLGRLADALLPRKVKPRKTRAPLPPVPASQPDMRGLTPEVGI